MTESGSHENGTTVTEESNSSAAPVETQDKTAVPPKKASGRKSTGGLGGKVLAELQVIATDLGIKNVKGMRKGALIDAIKEARGDVPAGAPKSQNDQQEPKPAAPSDDSPQTADQVTPRAEAISASRVAEQPTRRQRNRSGGQNSASDRDPGGQDSQPQNGPPQNTQNQNTQNRNGQNQNEQSERSADDDDSGPGRRRNRRGRNRNRGMDSDPTYSEDDVLVPAAGILDVLENYAFVRTTGYQPSDQDVYVSLSMVRKWSLRRGDAITGQVRQPREGERKEKFNPMVKVETVNGLSLDDAAKRHDFARLTAIHPNERLRLQTASGSASTGVIDLVAPIGKGQRGLIASEAKAGRTTLLHKLAGSITQNNPECHLMVVLIDQRPEEVTDFVSSVKGEVVASPFDRPAADHTTVAELAIERAKRLVELGHDVVVLVDGLSRLGRAYQQAAAQSSRTNTHNSDAAALSSAKHFFAAARNIEDGGSLTIVATANLDDRAEPGAGIFAELLGTENSEIRLSPELAAAQLYPAVDVAASGTRRADLLLSEAELAEVVGLRSRVVGLDTAEALRAVLDAAR